VQRPLTGPARPAAGAAAALIAAAAALPMPRAHAIAQPDEGLIGIRYLDYRDRQPGLERIRITSPSLQFVVPIGERWSIDGHLVTDAISGASPAYYSVPASASKLTDRRDGGDLRVTLHQPRWALTLGVAGSHESDYRSGAASALLRVASEDRNTTASIGLGSARDRIDPVNRIVRGERRRVDDAILGITRVLTQLDVVQANLFWSWGDGYYSDPYKLFDTRPRNRRQFAVLARWNHRFRELDASARLAWRYYRDSFGMRSHTITGEWEQELGRGWSITPTLRLYTQGAADFFAPPDPARPGVPAIPDGFRYGTTLVSFDQRLAAFGGATLGVKLAWRIDPRWSVDLRFDRYRQKAGWAFAGSGTAGIAPFDARFLQLGVQRRF